MASYRHMREDPPETVLSPPEYTKKEKAANWWHYNWGWVAASLAVVLLVGWFVGSMVTRVEPDIIVGIITSDSIPDELREALEIELSGRVADYNGDGKRVAVVQIFRLSFVLEMAEREDPQARMAEMTRFTVAASSSEPLIFLVDKSSGQAQAMQDEIGLLGYPDGKKAPEKSNVDEVAAAWGQTTLAKAALPFQDMEGGTLNGQDYFETFLLGIRPLEAISLKDKKGGQETWENAFAFYMQLLGG